MGITGFVVDIGAQPNYRNGNRDVEEPKGGARDGPGEAESRLEIGSEIAKFFQFQMTEGSNTDDVIDILEKELTLNEPEDEVELGVMGFVVGAAIGSVALDMARIRNDKTATDYGLSVLTVAFLGILITAPIGAVIIGLLGPKLLHKSNQQDSNHGE
eukprot:g43346.t1